MLRAQVAALLRTEARLYTTRAALDRQLAIHEHVHGLGVALIGADSVTTIGALTTELITLQLRCDVAVLMWERGDGVYTVVGEDGFDSGEAAMVRALELPHDDPFVRHVIEHRLVEGPGTLVAGGRLGVETIAAQALLGGRAVLLAGRRAAGELDDVSRRALASVGTLCAATLDATSARVALAHDRALLAQRVEERTRDLKRALDEVTRLSRTDALTGLINRRAFMEDAEYTLARARRHGRPFALVAVDVDHFKPINDMLGHQVGDAALVAVAAALVRSVREADRVGRIGGEEFMILLAETTPATVAEVAERCRQTLHGVDWPAIDRRLLPVTASFGIAIYPDHGTELDALIHRADLALYRAKHAGRDAIVTFTAEIAG